MNSGIVLLQFGRERGVGGVYSDNIEFAKVATRDAQSIIFIHSRAGHQS